jgi:hypothetical protein
MTNGTEYYSIKLRITNAKTVGDGACGGCPEPVCLVLNTVRIAQPAPLPTFNIYDPRDSNYASWQTPWVCGGVCCIAIETGEVSNPQLPDCIPTPVEPRTWGLLKSLYR